MVKLKETWLSRAGSASGVVSILGSWQVCHNICLALISVLAVIGITVTGMPLLFLTKVALPLWMFAVTLLIVGIIIYLKKACISKHALMFNAGLIITGTPFQIKAQWVFWVIGGLIMVYAALLFAHKRIKHIK